jgi:hypothetical protein
MANDLDEVLALAQKKKTPAQSRKILIEAGIFSSAGKLADHYKAKPKAGATHKATAQAKAGATHKATAQANAPAKPKAAAKSNAAAARTKASASKAAKKIEA